jgi:hypothetical protein
MPMRSCGRRTKAPCSTHDALYFDLAQVLGLPIATLDGGLRTAAKAHGVKLFAA